MSFRGIDKVSKYWVGCEQSFLKEFLLENVMERAWEAWDKCEIGKNTLVQYIAYCREVIVKLKGIGEFQKIRGFERGLKDTRLR